MKMETVIYAPFAARVKELAGDHRQPGRDRRRAGQAGADRRRRRGGRRRAPGPAPRSTCRHRRPGSRPRCARPGPARRSTAVVLGYDVPPQDQGAALVGLPRRPRGAARPRGCRSWPTRWPCSARFADLAELSRNRPADEERHTELRVHSSREHFHTFLQSLDVERGGLPEQFRDRLLRVLHHYGVEDLDRTPAMEEAVFRIFLAQQRSAPEVALASAVLGRWIDEPPPTGELAGRRAAAAGTARPRHPAALPGGRRPGPQRPVPLVRPAGRRRGARRRPRRGARRARRAGRGRRRCRTAPTGSRRWPRSPSRSSGSWPSGSRTAYRPGSRCWRCWRGVTTASTTCTTCESVESDGRPVRGRRLHARRPADPAGLDRRHRAPSWPTRGRRWPPRSATYVARAPRGRGGGRRPLPALARRPGRRPTPRASELRPLVERAAVRPRRTPGVRRRLRRRGAGRSATTPSGPPTTARWPRTT